MGRVMRWLVVVAFVMSLGTLARPATAQPEQPAQPSIEGTWSLVIKYHNPDGTVSNMQNLLQFSRDGRAYQFLPQAEGEAWNGSRTGIVGEWKRAGGRTFDVTYYCLWAMAWTDAPVVPDRILWKVRLAPDGKSMTGILVYQPFFDGEYVDFGWGELVATRLGMVPMP